MKILPLLFLAWLGAAALPATASALNPAAVASARRDLQSAMDHGDLDGMQAVRARFAAMADAEPGSALLQYWTGVAAWRALMLSRDKRQAVRFAQEAIERLDRALAADSRFAEALAVKASVQGMLVEYEPSQAMTLGPQSGANVGRALKLAPDNPRVRLLDGIGTLHKPALFGGSPKAAIETFREAQALFARETVSDSTAPDWGRDEAFLWEGRAAMKLKDHAAAREAYRLALAANPRNGWVRTRLLPEAEKALAAKEK